MPNSFSPEVSPGVSPEVSQEINPEIHSNNSPDDSPFPLHGEERWCEVPGLSPGLRYWQWSGEIPVLLLHGLTDQGLLWANLAQSLGAPYHWVAPDLRGHGDSGKPPHGYGCQDFIGDLQTLLDTLGWSRCHLVAHSWGCKLATLWATAEPQRFLSLTLVDPFFIGQLPPCLKITFPILYKTLPFLKTLGPFPDRPSLEATARGLKQYRDWTPHQQLLFATGMEQKADGTWGSKFPAVVRDEVFAEILQLPGLSQPVSVPARLLIPSQGVNRLPIQLKPCREFLTQLSEQTIPGNHWPMLTAVDGFHGAIQGWLSTVRV